MPNKKTAAQRQPYVDAMKGFGILCVVIGHFIEYHRGTAPGINALFTCIYLFHMAIFCTASGLVAKFSLRKLVTQQLWLYLISQAGITAFRAAALKDNIVDQGGLLLEGIGDTLRVSLTGDPEDEVYAGYDILRAVGYAVAGPEIISCPTCGRTQYPMIDIANEVERRLKEEGFKKPVKIAIMGCIVNGPGEASDADIGIAGGKDCAVLFEHGEKIRTLKGDIVSQFVEEIHKL